MSNVVSSAIFCVRNVDKAENQGKVGRVAPAAGQGLNVAEHIAQLENSIGKGTKTALEAMQTVAKNRKVLEYTGKAVRFASENVNPLICISSGIDVLTSKDKESALVTNAAALTSMFAVESLMKKHLDDVVKIKGIDKIAKKISEFAKTTKNPKAIPLIFHGVGFVIGSCAAYSIGEKFGKLLLGQHGNEKRAVAAN